MPTMGRLRANQLNDIALHVFQSFKHRPNFRGADWGYGWVNGKATPEISVRIHVEKKLPLSALPKGVVFPQSMCGMRLDVIEAPYGLPEQIKAPPSDGSSPYLAAPYLMGGVPCPAPGGRPGSIAMIVMDKTSNRPAILSNWHVLVGSNSIDAPLTKELLAADGDAAISILPDDAGWLPIHAHNLSSIQNIRPVKLGEILSTNQKSAAQSRSKVDGIGWYRITYETRPGVFEPIDIEGFRLAHIDAPAADQLASGCLYVQPDTHDAVGMQIAGHHGPQSTPKTSIACHLPQLMDRLNIRPATFEDLLDTRREKSMEKQPGRLGAQPKHSFYTDPSIPPNEEKYMPWSCFDTSLVVPVEAVKTNPVGEWIDPRNRVQSQEQRQTICLADPRDVNPPATSLPVFESVLDSSERTAENRNIVAEFWPELTQLF